jgi:pyruvate/2-oxoglutarate dehydrogenase complex dihydrolipoamide dehydrogenase (E3) component
MSSSTFRTQHYDLLVLGSGEAGKYIAWTMASAGKKAAVIERRYIGGSWACSGGDAARALCGKANSQPHCWEARIVRVQPL